jgi:hypothetical protein
MPRYILTVEIEAEDLGEALILADDLPTSFRPVDMYSRPWLCSYEMVNKDNSGQRMFVKIDPL